MPTLPEVIKAVNDAKNFGKMFNGASVTYKPRGDQPSGYFFKDINNAKRFTPENTPVRLPFNGYVNFIFNNNIQLNDLNNNADFQNRLSSMVQTSTMPSAEFATTVQNQYNRKRLTVSAVDFKPVQVVVYDTVDSLWVMMLMRMYAHLFTNPTNMYKSDGTKTIIKDDTVPESVASGDGTSTSGSFNRPFNSNSAGLNLQPANQRNFLTSIDVIQYHGQKAVRYTLFNPIITQFEIEGLNYTTSTASTISLSIQYENFTIDPDVNDWMDKDDLSRFSNYYTKDFEILRAGNKAENQNTSNQYPLELKKREASFLKDVSRREQTDFLSSFSNSGDTTTTAEPGDT